MRVKVWLPESSCPTECTPAQLGQRLGFRYISSLEFDTKELQERIFKEGRFRTILPAPLKYGRQYATEIREGRGAPTIVNWLNPKIGFGLIADTALKTADYIGEYLGKIRPNDLRDGTNDYLFGYPLFDLVIDARGRGNHCRFINHSNTPNTLARIIFDGTLYRIIFIATKEIVAGEEIVFDYGAAYWKGRELT